MSQRPRRDALFRFLAIFAVALCGVGAAAAFFVVMVRVPALAHTKLELLFGTLQGTAVALLFAIAALMIVLTSMIHRAVRLPSLALLGERDGRRE